MKEISPEHQLGELVVISSLQHPLPLQMRIFCINNAIRMTQLLSLLP